MPNAGSVNHIKFGCTTFRCACSRTLILCMLSIGMASDTRNGIAAMIYFISCALFAFPATHKECTTEARVEITGWQMTRGQALDNMVSQSKTFMDLLYITCCWMPTVFLESKPKSITLSCFCSSRCHCLEVVSQLMSSVKHIPHIWLNIQENSRLLNYKPLISSDSSCLAEHALR